MAEVPSARYRFGVFEADVAAGELRRAGMRIRLHAQPFAVLCLLLDRPGEVLTREEICRELWPDGTFVDYEHGVNSAVNRLREALGDKAASPRYVETVARRGYRFVAPVERIGADAAESGVSEAGEPAVAVTGWAGETLLAQAGDLPQLPAATVRVLLVLLQAMYVSFYVGALANLGEISQLLADLKYPAVAYFVLVASAAMLIPVRAFVVSAVLLRPPRLRERFLKLWPVLLAADALWSLAPFLLLHHINTGVALACTALLLYAPFAQRSLMLMLTREV
jgi:cholera toxin transcriptional activator